MNEICEQSSSSILKVDEKALKNFSSENSNENSDENNFKNFNQNSSENSNENNFRSSSQNSSENSDENNFRDLNENSISFISTRRDDRISKTSTTIQSLCQQIKNSI